MKEYYLLNDFDVVGSVFFGDVCVKFESEEFILERCVIVKVDSICI